jgi:hypothetical protein
MVELKIRNGKLGIGMLGFEDSFSSQISTRFVTECCNKCLLNMLQLKTYLVANIY